MGLDQSRLTPEVVFQLDDPRLGYATGAGQGPQAIELFSDQLSFRRGCEQVLLRFLKVFAEETDGEQSVTGMDRVAGIGVDSSHDAGDW